MASLYDMTKQTEELYELLQNDEIDETVYLDTIEAMTA